MITYTFRVEPLHCIKVSATFNSSVHSSHRRDGDGQTDRQINSSFAGRCKVVLHDNSSLNASSRIGLLLLCFLAGPFHLMFHLSVLLVLFAEYLQQLSVHEVRLVKRTVIALYVLHCKATQTLD